MLEMISAHELDSDVIWPQFPRTSQEIYQWKPKSRGKKTKSQFDDTRTDISYSASTAGGDVDFDTSTYVSKELVTSSSRSVESKRSKKRSKKSPKDLSGSVHSEPVSTTIRETPDRSKDTSLSVSYLVNLECPLCNDDDCILNKAVKCPLLRHNDTEPTDCCTFCGQNCVCIRDTGKFLPVSGLVPRDENGVALTLLKANGGPIENSFEWANRRRWDVPSYVRWEHKISEWTTSPTQENAKADDIGQRKKLHKSRNKRKNRNTASAAAAVPENVNSEEPKVEEEEPQQQHEGLRLYAEGQGFKIFVKGGEKVLINYDRKNCKYIGCSCVPKVDAVNHCGCSEGRAQKGKVKQDKSCSHKPRISLLKETPQGMEPLDRKELEGQCDKAASKSNEVVAEKSASVDKGGDLSNEKQEKAEVDKHDSSVKCMEREAQSNTKHPNLTAKDFRNLSRADLLESSLKQIFGDDYKNGNDAVESPKNQKQSDEQNFTSVFCPQQTGGNQYGGNFGPCICAQGCCP